MAKRLLFVDDEPTIRDLYASIESALGHGHQVFTASSGDEGLELMAQTQFDVVVSDLAMPEMDGIEFLNEVLRAYPESARIVVSGFADRLKIAECLTVGHRFFSKPFNFRTLVGLLKRICQYSYLVNSEKLRRVVCGSGALPTPPETYLRLSEALNSPYSDLNDIGRIVEHDAGLTTKLLHIVNSAQFGVSRQVVTPSEAVQVIGVEILRALMLGVHAFGFYESKPFAADTFKELWAHCLRTAAGARKIALAEGLPIEKAEEFFLAGLLHDIGKLVLSANAEKEYRLVLNLSKKASVPLHLAERGIFAATHAEVGAYLLALWGIPDAVIRAVELHHSLDDESITELCPAIGIHAAQNLDPEASRMKWLNMAALQRIGLDDRVPFWRKALAED